MHYVSKNQEQWRTKEDIVPALLELSLVEETPVNQKSHMCIHIQYGM